MKLGWMAVASYSGHLFMLVVTPIAGMLTHSVAVGFVTLISGYTLVPVCVLINRARKLLNAGFGHSDIGVAFKAEIDRTREERAYGLGHGGGPSVLERILRWIGGIGVTTAMVTLTVMNTLEPYGFTLMTTFAWSLTIGVVSAMVALIMLQRRRDVDAEFWGRFWTGR